MLEISQYALNGAIAFTILGLLAEVLFITGKRNKQSENPWYTMAFTLVALALTLFYLGVRMVNTGHGPFANQHEFSVAFSAGILGALALFVWRYKFHILSVVVLPVVTVMLIYATQLDTELKPLVPALQNSVLLTFHVGFAVFSYGAACVSFGAAVLYLITPYVRSKYFPSAELCDEVGYRAAALAFPLLTIMIILGSVWANVAWGRYWGWDPKETAAFVTWLFYGAFLHARVVRNWRGTKSAWLLIIGFIAVLFAYFGNHFFGGLHSYA